MDILAESIERTVNDDGEIPAGALFVSVKNIGDQDITVNGNILGPGKAKSWPFVGKGYKSIPYQASGSSMEIMTVI